MPNVKRGSYYTQFDDLKNWTAGDITPITKGKDSGRSYQLYTKQVVHKEFSWRLKKGALAFISSILIVPLVRKDVRQLWTQAFSGKEIKRIKFLLPEQKAPAQKSKTPESTETKPTETKPPEVMTASVESAAPSAAPDNTSQTLPSSPKPDKDRPQSATSNLLLPGVQETAAKVHTLKTSSDKAPPKPACLNEQLVDNLVELFEGRRPASEKELSSILDVLIEDPELETSALPNPPQEERTSLVSSSPLESLWSLNGWDLIRQYFLQKRGEFTSCDAEHLNLVLKRIEILDRAINLLDRLNATPYIRSNVTAQDIALPWSQSALKLILMTHPERNSITYSQTRHFSNRQTAFLRDNYYQFRNSKLESDPDLETIESINELTLTQMRELPPKALDRLIGQVPTKDYFFFTYPQLASIDIEKLNDEQFKAIYNGSETLKYVQPEHLRAVLMRLKKLSADTLEYLPGKQIQKLDFTDEELVDQEFFLKCTKKNDRIADLTSQQLNICFNKGWITKEKAQKISRSQIQELDLAGLDLKKLGENGLFTAMLQDAFSKERPINSLAEQNLNLLLPYIDPALIKDLDKDHIPKLDMQVISKEQFEMLPKAAKPFHTSTIGHGIWSLSIPQVQLALQRGLFSERTAPYVTTETLKAIDLTDELIGQMGGAKVLNALLKNRISTFEVPIIESLLPHLDSETLKKIQTPKLQALHAEDPGVFITRKTIESLGERIKDLSATQLLLALRNGYLDETNAVHIPIDFLIQAELEPTDLNDNTKKVIQKILQTNKSQSYKLEPKKLNAILTAFPAALIVELRENQVKGLAVSKMNLEQFENLSNTFQRNTSYFSEKDNRAYQLLSGQQIADALLKGFIYDESSGRRFSSDQIQSVPFEKVVAAFSADSGVPQEIQIAINCLIKGRMSRVSRDSFKALLPYLSDDNLKADHNSSSIALIDFKKELSLERFAIFAGRYNVQNMSAQQVYDALNGRLFSNDNAIHVTREHIQAINFTTLSQNDLSELKLIINAMLKKLAHVTKVRFLSKPNTAHLLTILSEENLSELKEDDVIAIDFDRADLSASLLVALTKAAKSPYQPYLPKGLGCLTSKQIIDCLKHKLFNEETFKGLDYQQKFNLKKAMLANLDQEDEFVKKLMEGK